MKTINTKKLNYLGGGIFEGCSSLKSIDISKVNDIQLGPDIFKDCISLKHVKLSSEIAFIWSGSFMGCESLKKLTITGAHEIDNDVFNGCKSLTLYGYAGSYVQKYAKKHNIPFKKIK